MTRFLPFVVLLLIAVGCGDDSTENTPTPPTTPPTIPPTTPVTTVLVKVKIDPASGFSDTKDWLIVNDSQGKLLAYHTFESGQSFDVTTTETVTDKIIVSRLRTYFDDPSDQALSLLTWAEITPGQEFIVPAKSTQGTSPTATFTIKLDFETDEDLTSRAFGASASCIKGITSAGGGWSIGQPYEMQSKYYDGVTKYLLTAFEHDEMRYKFFEGVHAGDVKEIKFRELTPFEHQVEFTFPETDHVFLSTNQADAGQKSTTGQYLLTTHWPDGIRSSIKAGYVEGLGEPVTVVDLTYETGYRVTYTNNGSIPTGHVNWPAFEDYKVSSEDINTFAYNAPASTKFRDGLWSYREGTTFYSWTFHSPKHEHVIPTLPTELLIKYPGIKMEKFEFESSYFSVVGYTYEQYIKNYFEKSSVRPEESLEIVVSKK